MNAVPIIIVGFIMLIGLGWQGYLIGEKDSKKNWEKDGPPGRLYAPLAVGMIVILGVFVYGLICLFDSKKTDYKFETFLLWNAKAIVFALVLNLKSYLGPLTASFCLSCEVYFLFEYGQLRPIPLLSALAGWVFEFAPDAISAVYLVISVLYCLVSSGIESATDMGS
jgi:hypothetical protein